MNNKKIGVTVNIIAVIYLIGAVLDLLVGLGLLFAEDSVIRIFPKYLADHGKSLGIAQICLSGLGFAVGWALWNNKKWAKAAVIIIGAVQITGSWSEIMTSGHDVSTVVKSILKIALSLAIMLFLLNRRVSGFLNEKRRMLEGMGA
jgi:hypothetical protein